MSSYIEHMAEMTGKTLEYGFQDILREAEVKGPIDGAMDRLEKRIEGLVESVRHEVKAGTELCIVLNWKSWEWSEKGADEVAKLYDKWWKELDGYILDTWTGDDLTYFLRETD